MKHPFSTLAAVFFLFCLTPFALAEDPQYAPAAGQTGSTAVHLDDASILGWATGYSNLIYGSDVIATWRTPEKAMGAAAGTVMDIVSLGNAGQITLSFFPAIICNGPGPDFVIFENALNDTFLELAYLEVSSDGENFFRFPNHSLTPRPVNPDGDPLTSYVILAVDPVNVDGFASKYRVGFGTPFDLDGLNTPQAQQGVLSGTLNLDHIAYVRIIDIVGDGTSTDTSGNPIYDPWHPTQPQTSAGFDLEAAGYMHNHWAGDLNLDDQLDLADVILGLQVLAGLPAEGVSTLRDRNGDGKIGWPEIISVLSYLQDY